MQVAVVRHAEPETCATLPPERWPLSPQGRRAAQQLRHRVPAEGLWVSSVELKAIETLQCLSPRRPVVIMQDPRFNEVRREEPFDEDFMSRRRAWIEGELDRRHARWENPREAAERFDRAVRDYAASEQRLVIGSHGMVITAWLIGRGHVRAGTEAGRFWETLAFPDLVTVDIA